MSRRKSVSTNVLEKLVQQQEQPSKDFLKASEEFFKHCKIKGLSPDTVKFYEIECNRLLKLIINKVLYVRSNSVSLITVL